SSRRSTNEVPSHQGQRRPLCSESDVLGTGGFDFRILCVAESARERSSASQSPAARSDSRGAPTFAPLLRQSADHAGAARGRSLRWRESRCSADAGVADSSEERPQMASYDEILASLAGG